MEERTPDHMEKVYRLIEMAKKDDTIRTVLMSGDKSKVMDVLKKVDLSDDDIELINEDLDAILITHMAYGWWRVGG